MLSSSPEPTPVRSAFRCRTNKRQDQRLRFIIQGQIVCGMERDEVGPASFCFAAVDCHSCGTGEEPVLQS